MKKALFAVMMLVAVVAFSYEERIATLTGTTSQVFVFGSRTDVCLQATTMAVRYRLGTAANPPVATTTDARIAVGDCYRLMPRNGMDRVAVIHDDGVSSFTAYLYDVVSR